MSEYIRVSVPRMSTDESNIQEKMRQIRDEVMKLQAAMQGLASCWEGPAWNAFQNQVSESIQYMIQVNEWVQSYLAAGEEAARCYQKGEKQVRDRISSLRI